RRELLLDHLRQPPPQPATPLGLLGNLLLLPGAVQALGRPGEAGLDLTETLVGGFELVFDPLEDMSRLVSHRLFDEPHAATPRQTEEQHRRTQEEGECRHDSFTDVHRLSSVQDTGDRPSCGSTGSSLETIAAGCMSGAGLALR